LIIVLVPSERVDSGKPAIGPLFGKRLAGRLHAHLIEQDDDPLRGGEARILLKDLTHF